MISDSLTPAPLTALDLGNTETVSRGVTLTNEGWLALSYTRSKTFKTERGALKWLARKSPK